jgi:hypothetical protein
LDSKRTFEEVRGVKMAKKGNNVNYPDVVFTVDVPKPTRSVQYEPESFKEWREDRIRKIAGKKWLDAGAPHGRADEFWFAAEAEYEAMQGEPR